MLHILVWKWKPHNVPAKIPALDKREQYTSLHVNVMSHMLRRHMGKKDYRLICVTDDAAGIQCETFPLWTDFHDLFNASGNHLPSCYRRLKAFDPNTQREMGIKKGDRIAWVDLDAVIVGNCESVFSTAGRFVGWGVPGIRHPRVYNGSFVMWTAGDLEELWKNFDPKGSPAICHKNGYFGSDQGWLSYNMCKRQGEAVGVAWPQIASWPREIRRIGRVQVSNRIIFFHGRNKPWHSDTMRMGGWIKNHWRLNNEQPAAVAAR